MAYEHTETVLSTLPREGFPKEGKINWDIKSKKELARRKIGEREGPGRVETVQVIHTVVDKVDKFSTHTELAKGNFYVFLCLPIQHAIYT